MTAQVLSYSRSKGVFGGLELKGTSITSEKKEVTDVYGEGVTAEQVLKTPESKAPKEVQVFPDMLASFTAAKAASK